MEGFELLLTPHFNSFKLEKFRGRVEHKNMFDQMNYQIYPYHINKITNENTNYSPPPYLILKTSKQGGG